MAARYKDYISLIEELPGGKRGRIVYIAIHTWPDIYGERLPPPKNVAMVDDVTIDFFESHYPGKEYPQ